MNQFATFTQYSIYRLDSAQSLLSQYANKASKPPMIEYE